MNFIKEVESILGNGDDCSKTILNLSNLLIPKLMHIPNNQIPEILAFLEARSILIENESTYPLPILIKALLNYKLSNYQLSIRLVTEVLDNPFFEISDVLMAMSYTTIAINHRSIGERDAAFNFFQKALELYPEEVVAPYLIYLYGINL